LRATATLESAHSGIASTNRNDPGRSHLGGIKGIRLVDSVKDAKGKEKQSGRGHAKKMQPKTPTAAAVSGGVSYFNVGKHRGEKQKLRKQKAEIGLRFYFWFCLPWSQ
jgi:hypothetical protein